MTGRWSDPSAFRADPAAPTASRPSRRQALALLVAVALVAAAVAVASYVVRPAKARAFDLFHGSLFLQNQGGPVAVDLATGKPTLLLQGADDQVGITGSDVLGVVPLDNRTLLVNQRTGEFNMVDSSGFVVKHDGGGVTLGNRSGTMKSIGIASDDGEGYIERTGPIGGTEVYLVNQSTVESAINAKHPAARATARLAGSGSTDPGAAAAAGGDLWLLVGRAGDSATRTIERLHVPANSSAGADLRATSRGTVDGAAAIGTATAPSGRTTVAVASADRIQTFAPGQARQIERFAAPAGVNRILPITNGADRIGFLLHGSTGWSIVSVGADGSGLRGPKLINGLSARLSLAEPAASNGDIYTIDPNRHTYRIGYGGTAQVGPMYPIVGKIESEPVPDASVIARGPRVVFNSRTHADALMLFTDGTHAPMTIEKRAAVAVSASGGAEALTKPTVTTGQQPGKTHRQGQPKPKPQPVQEVNDQINCKTINQKPHIPQITSTIPGSRTVALQWTYPVLSNQDCVPSTYQVSVTQLDNHAPPPPTYPLVQGQTGVTLTGLFPSTRYSVTVTALINKVGTRSTPRDFTTGVEGPAAPTGLAVRADASGNWDLAWNSCGTVRQGCVPAQSWTVTPSFCDGRGVSTPPDPLTETADPTSVKQPPTVYKGGDALLGRGLQFEVQGTGDQGQAGTPSAKSPCVYSWSAPDVSAMRLSASKPANTALGGSTTTNVTLDLGSNPVRDAGGVGAKVTFTLSGDGTTQTKGPVVFNGKSSNVSANFGGVRAGTTYTATASIRAAHGGGAVSTAPVEVTTRSDWPDVSLSPSCPRTSAISCELSVQINGITSAQANNETFDFDGVLECGSTGFNISKTSFDPAVAIDAGSVSQLNKFFGACAVSGQLRESPESPQPEVFGGTVENLGPTNVDLGAPTRSGAGQGDFDVSWDPNGGNNVRISYTGQADLQTLTQNWSETVTAPDGKTDCGDPDRNDTPNTTVHVNAQCVNRFAGQGAWTVSISYQDSTDGAAHGPFTYSLPNAAPGFAYCTPGNFSAIWGTDPAAPTVSVMPPTGDTRGCGGWSYKLTDPTGATCPTTNGTGAPPVVLSVSCDTSAPGDWKLTISWTGPSATQPVTITVGGTPPSPPPPSPSPSPSPTPT